MPSLLCHYSFKYLPVGLARSLALSAWNSCLFYQGKLLCLALCSEISIPHLLALPLLKHCLVLTFLGLILMKKTSCSTHPSADHQSRADSIGSLLVSPSGQPILVSDSSLNSPTNLRLLCKLYFTEWACGSLFLVQGLSYCFLNQAVTVFALYSILT